MRIVIVGGGLAGTNLALALGGAGHDVTLVDRDPSIAARGFAEHGLAAIVGDGTDPRVLTDADVGRADVVAAMLRRDADNLAVAAIARSFGAKRILARLRDPAYRTIYARAGIDQVFGEIETMVGALSVAMEHPRVTHSMVLGTGDSIAFEIVVPERAEVAGRTVREIGTSQEFPRGAVIAGIAAENGSVVAPRGDSVVRGGHSVLCVSRREDVATTIDLLTRVRAS
ncbi:potassium channel family protein [Sandaracinus amylolyticus]|uniref:Trk system potassium uptake protein TrkA n=1 Tax=Sandaracinus amylolyticus TaxID=927083 RepID=A0A0F6YHK0_9BACT|nr:TrkA family potassium uptake protein [Sandaracinus amylolyticus]AKF04145.1 Trk system potassium uptake protein TrkA [Sandaracinus amylolyticus]